jgi:hypothetical protein
MQSSIRIYLLLLGILLLLAVVVVLFVGVNFTESVNESPIVDNSNRAEEGQQQIVPVEVNIDTASVLYLNTRAGTPFPVKNFLRNVDTKTYDENVFLIASDSGPNGALYEIFFYRGGSFGITLLDPNLEFARNRAEQAMRDLLEVSDIRLCSLIISMSVPQWLSQQLVVDYSGIDYGVSFCPNGQPIEPV